MNPPDEIKAFYMEHLTGAEEDGHLIKAACPICSSQKGEKPGTIVVYLDPGSFFMGYFRCLNRCRPGGFPSHFGRMLGLEPDRIPGYDPDREAYIRDIVYPTKNLHADIKKFQSLMGDPEYAFFEEFGVSKAVLEEMKIGYNGRYLVYPYFMEDGNCYAAHCMLPERVEDHFWHGDEAFFSPELQVYNVQDIERCENGSLFVTEGERNLLALKALGYPGIAVPNFKGLDNLRPEMLGFINHLLILVNHSPEAALSARTFATRLGYKARIIKWPSNLKRGYSLCRLAREKGKGFRSTVSAMVKESKSFSPFPSPERESLRFFQFMEREKGKELLGLKTGFDKMDRALNGIRGINIMGGQPKAGKSCFFMQLSTEIARTGTPVIYYDFENGRQKIYTRTLCRLSRLSEKDMRGLDLEEEPLDRLQKAQGTFKELLHFFRVVTDRNLNPDIMKRQIDFLQHETRTDYTLVVVDSLHKLPFRDLSERRTGIDEWLRNIEAIRDEQNVSFLVISELSRGEGGHYDERPDLGVFKESGDIEYSADNAMVLVPKWNPLEPTAPEERRSLLWLVASRENNPGRIGEYALEYPFWGFREI